MVDNFELIENLLEFRSSDDFYFVQIIQRKKDHKEEMKVEGSNNNSRLIKMYTISSVEYLRSKKSEIIELSNLFNARAGIDLNRKSYQQCSLQTARLIMDQFLNKNYSGAIKAYSSVCGRFSNESEKKWIIDIDKEQLNKLSDIKRLLEHPDLEPTGNKIIAEIPSNSGIHLITKPFNLDKFRNSIYAQVLELDKIEIHKMNPTNLYIP